MRPYWFYLSLLTLVPALSAQELGTPRVTVVDSKVLVSVHFENAFENELIERIESGLPTGFTYEFKLQKDRRHWWDADVMTSTLEVAAMYNAVSREYLVNFKLDGRLIESRISRDLQDLENTMTRIDSLELFSLSDLPPGARLSVKARVQLGSRALFSLIPTRIETEWRESSKFVASQE